MRIWIHSTVKTAAVGPSSMLSVVVHVALVGAAVYGTGVSAREIEQKIAERIYFLPPPDRRPASDYVAEHLQYMDLGRANPAPAEKGDTRQSREGNAVVKKVDGDAGREMVSQAPAIATEAQDSVYSILEVDETAVRTSGSAAPVYPPELMKEGKEGGVFIRFIVDTTGRADPASIEVIRATHPLFSEAVRQAVPLMMFTPAMVRGRPVRQAVEQNFEFRIAAVAAAEHTKTKPAP